ncbi:hypothetical protein AB0L40_24985, partial [Patulibacter sp. NPDC049589]
MSPRGRRGGGARSEDDRQRARLEREQRRAQREGRPVPKSIDELPVGEPSLDVSGLVPDAPGAPFTSDAPSATPPDGPAGRRERLAALRGATADRPAVDARAADAGAVDGDPTRTPPADTRRVERPADHPAASSRPP